MRLRLLALALLAAGCSGHAAVKSTPSTPDSPTCKSMSHLKPVTGSIYYKVGDIAVNLPPGKSCVFPDGTQVSN